MLYLSKEASNKDQNVKTQMMTLNDDNDFQKTETIWKSKGFFKEQRPDLTIKKPNFPENTLIYVNQGSISPIKGEQAIAILPVCHLLTQILKSTWTITILRIMRFCCLFLHIIHKLDCIKV